jgi:universal stress protein E
MSADHPTLRQLFVVIDPTQEPQQALERAIRMQRVTALTVHLFVCVFDPATESGPADLHEQTRNAIVERYRAWLERLARPLLDAGVAVTREVAWNADWRESILRAVDRQGSDIVIKSTFRHTVANRVLFRTSDRILLRGCACPVLLVKSALPWSSGRVLGCIEPDPGDEAHARLNDAVVAYAKALGEGLGIGTHLAVAYGGADARPDAASLARSTGLARDRIHLRDADADDAIVAIAKELDVDIVVIGTIARTGAAALVVGNTAEKILDRLDTDVLSVPAADTA